MKGPDFFIVGAPKSGTTALSEYLRQHPNVTFSTPKEPHYFNDDFSHRHINNLEDYLKCFEPDGGENILGEGSVFYLYSKTAIPNILKISPNAKFVVMLRNPVEAAYSWHWQSMYSFGEDITNFEQAWKEQPHRLSGKHLPRDNRVREALHYGPLFRYADQLERLYLHVPEERVKVIIYDDFKCDAKRVYLDVLSFLGLPPLEISEYGVINSSKRIRYPLVEKLVYKAVRLKRTFNIHGGLGIAGHIKRWNTKHQSRPPLSDSFRKELIEYYRDDVVKTSELIGRNLEEWTNA